MAFAGIAGAPLVWLTALQSGYVLAYQACDDQSRAWVTVPTVVLLAVTAATLILTVVAKRRARQSLEPRPLLASLGLGIASLMVIVMIASTIAPVMLQPCD
jgi:hypothetical protein